MKSIYLLVSIFMLMATGCFKNDSSLTLNVKSTDYVSENVPVHLQINLPVEFQNLAVENIGVTMNSQDGSHQNIPGQITLDDQGQHQLWWIIPRTNADKDVAWKATFHKSIDPSIPVFSWEDTPGKHMDLLFDNKKVFRYEYELDSQRVKGETLTAKNKVFYHVYDLDGKNLITNGYGPGEYPHHRGIMIGWRNVGFRGQDMSFWGMEDLTTQKHIRFIKKTAGPVVSQLESLIHWNDSTGNTIIEEIRSATVYNQPEPAILLLDFSSDLKAIGDSVTLSGDPEHAGVQYRAHNDVAADAPGSSKPTYYFNQENTDPRKDYNLPWVGMSYELNHKTYSVVDMNGSGNPEPTIWSAYRDYGRFGPYVKYDLGKNESLHLNYRFWISESTMPGRGEITAKYEAYQHPVKVTVE